jgi:phosphoribosylanthranilate isomerase
VFVKICGITNESDALLAVAMGADAVSFVFAPSARQIAPVIARDIARRLPPEIITLGVFRDESAQRVVEVVNTMGLRGAQLHGRETPDQAAWVSSRVPVTFKAFGIDDPMLDRADEYEVDAVVIDAPSPGSGEVFDWTLVERLPVSRRIILAGGLTPENVAQAIDQVKPWGVDVSSGVEAAPGRKDPLKLRYFLNAAKADDDEELWHAQELAGVPEMFDWQDEAAD